MARVLVIGDTHIPFHHPGYLRFCKDLRNQYKCDRTVHIGDVVDLASISFHVPNPEVPGPRDEHAYGRECLKPWVKAFPDARICIGNHDARIVRKAASVSIPENFLKTFNEIWETPKWKWAKQHIIDDVLYLHGTGHSGMYPAANAMNKLIMSVVMGHIHTAAGIHWKANPTRRIFGMSVGTGIDDKAAAFSYADTNALKSILSAAVVIDGTPTHVIMPCGPGEKYHRSRYGKNRR